MLQYIHTDKSGQYYYKEGIISINTFPCIKRGRGMAKDKMVLLLKDVWVNDIRELSGWQYLKSSHRLYKHGILIYHKDEIFLKLMKYSPQKGDLYIDFNPAKIKYGEIDSLNMDIFYGEICMLLDRELRGIFRCDTFFETNKIS